MKKENLRIVLQSKTPKIYKSKKLNTANFNDFTHNDYQVFLHLVSKIGGVNEFGKYLQPEQLRREYLLAAKEFSEVFNVSLSNCYEILKKAVDKLMKTDIRIQNPDNSGFYRINVCSMAEYNKHNSYINIKFTDDIMPYLAQVRERFVLYNLREIANFGILYTTRLYELLQEFKETGWMLKSLENLREVFAVGDKYKFYGHFKSKTFDHACQEINANYNINLRFEEIKESRKVIAIKFFFDPVRVYRTINQKTGNYNNIYIKPKAKKRVFKAVDLKQPKLLEDQAESCYTQALSQESKPIKNVLASLFSKIKLFSKR